MPEGSRVYSSRYPLAVCLAKSLRWERRLLRKDAKWQVDQLAGDPGGQPLTMRVISSCCNLRTERNVWSHLAARTGQDSAGPFPTPLPAPGPPQVSGGAARIRLAEARLRSGHTPTPTSTGGLGALAPPLAAPPASLPVPTPRGSHPSWGRSQGGSRS